VGVDLRACLRDHARRGLGVNRLKVAGGKVGQGFFSEKERIVTRRRYHRSDPAATP
jgi:hypothetical protein